MPAWSRAADLLADLVGELPEPVGVVCEAVHGQVVPDPVFHRVHVVCVGDDEHDRVPVLADRAGRAGLVEHVHDLRVRVRYVPARGGEPVVVDNDDPEVVVVFHVRGAVGSGWA